MYLTKHLIIFLNLKSNENVSHVAKYLSLNSLLQINFLKYINLRIHLFHNA